MAFLVNVFFLLSSRCRSLSCVNSQVSFPVGGQSREHLIRDLQRDVDFLENANIMDYSLFVAFWSVLPTLKIFSLSS
jgi:hypothetical protein